MHESDNIDDLIEEAILVILDMDPDTEFTLSDLYRPCEWNQQDKCKLFCLERYFAMPERNSLIEQGAVIPVGRDRAGRFVYHFVDFEGPSLSNGFNFTLFDENASI